MSNKIASTMSYVEPVDCGAQEHTGCYIFAPFPPQSQRSPKRRRTKVTEAKSRQKSKEAGAAIDDGNETGCPFPQLLGGKESTEAVQSRWNTYRKLWQEQDRRTNEILASLNKTTLDEVASFSRDATPEKYEGKLPTALILTGPNIASHGPLFEQIVTRISMEERTGPVILLSSKDATNLKATLKKLIKDATQENQSIDDEDEAEIVVAVTGQKKLLNYDLQILQNWCQIHPSAKVTVAIQDTEAFDSLVLSDLISLFSAYLNRIPFVLLLGIATSVDIFHDKLPKSTIRLLRGKKFDVEKAEECLAKICNDATIGQSVLRLGPSLCNFLLGRHRDHTQSIQAFVAALKYAYMSHFYANPLSIILGFLDAPDELNKILQLEHLHAVRNLPSFRSFVEEKLSEEDTVEIRALLDDDEYLRSIIPTACGECHSYALGLSQCLQVLEIARTCTPSIPQNKLVRHDLYSKALLGELDGSPIIRELLLTIKKMDSTKLLGLLDRVLTQVEVPYLQARLGPLKEEILGLLKDSEKKNLNSEFNITNDSLRATVVSKRVQLREKKSILTKEESEYSKLVQQVHEDFEGYFARNLKGLESVFLHEIFFYDFTSPHRDVFAPKPRALIERGLSYPEDYLACSCCNDEHAENSDGDIGNTKESSILQTNPPTSILYKLYLESGALINIYDLWTAFYAIVSGKSVEEEGEDDDEDNEHEYRDEQERNGRGRVDKATAQALFYRSLAELRFLGFVKSSKRKTDHLAKLAWKGL